MLTLNDVKIEVQSFGTVWAVFLTGDRPAVEARFNSFWNWKGITGDSAELDWWTDTCAMFWSYPKNFTYAMTMAALQEILNARDTKGVNPISEAATIAGERIKSIERVQLINYTESTCMGLETEKAPKE